MKQHDVGRLQAYLPVTRALTAEEKRAMRENLVAYMKLHPPRIATDPALHTLNFFDSIAGTSVRFQIMAASVLILLVLIGNLIWVIRNADAGAFLYQQSESLLLATPPVR